MSVRYYAESMYGSEYWQIVCEDLETNSLVIVGKNLSQHFARKLADDLQEAVDKSKAEKDLDISN